MENTLQEMLQQLAKSRTAAAEAAAELKAKKLQFEQDNFALSENALTLLAEVSELEGRIKRVAVDEYNATSNKKPALGVEVKLFAVAEIDQLVIARNWCFANLPAALVIDEKKVKQYAVDFGDVPGVTVTIDVPRAQIATKL